MKKLIFCMLICSTSWYQIFYAAEEKQEVELTLRDRMHQAIVSHKNPEQVQQCLEEGFALARYFSDPLRIKPKSYDQHKATQIWLNRYFMYPQQHGPAKNLMQILLNSERSYAHSDQKTDFLQIGQQFLDYGIDVHSKNSNGDTMAHVMAKKVYPDHAVQHHDFFRSLIAHGACMNNPNNHGDTPTHLAMQAEQPWRFIVTVLDAGGDLLIGNGAHRTPLDYASSRTKKIIPFYPIMGKKPCSKQF